MNARESLAGARSGQSVTHFPNRLSEIQKTNRETGLLKVSAAGVPVSGEDQPVRFSPGTGGGEEGLVQRFSLTSLEHLESEPI